ncbi:hypothetical protein GCM10007415_12620 [Parapedobacter pyrenivorans]|uniref:Uncharacterized protein n=1 Tax=Parapedobacter pyrenivorans TaxID=1305674 RepID=A0A917M712_9SPHI|nr:hypothetical protein [Parapedobacter pyrenivorans]GGG81447.1 hypothetical protein GCM10007415_12620 [Parapedobacter pyrenivorans]
MSLSHNERLFQVFEHLKSSSRIKTYISFGELIGENKAGVNDLKNDRKKVTIEHFFKLKNSYPELNTDYLIGVSDELLLPDSDGNGHYAPKASTPQGDQQAVIAALRETIASKNETIEALKSLLSK